MNNDKENKEWLKDCSALAQVARGNPFSVPDGYFNASEEAILSSVKILSFAPPSAKSFSVPENYFDELNSNVLSRVNLAEAVENESAFTVPENYFADMQAQLMSRVALQSASNGTHGYAIPDNYFETLNARILNQTVVADTIKKRGIVRKLVSTAAFKYASAACFILVVGIGVFLSQQGSTRASHSATYLHEALSNVPDNDIEGYLQLHMDASDTKSLIDKADNNELDNISADDLKDYLSNN